MDAVCFRWPNVRIQEMAAVGQKHWIPKNALRLHSIRCHTTGSRHALYALPGCARLRKNDHVLPVPRPTTRRDRIAERLSRATTGGNLLELPLREETDIATIGRPERKRRVVGGRHGLRLQCIQWP